MSEERKPRFKPTDEEKKRAKSLWDKELFPPGEIDQRLEPTEQGLTARQRKKIQKEQYKRIVELCKTELNGDELESRYRGAPIDSFKHGFKIMNEEAIDINLIKSLPKNKKNSNS